MLAVNDLEVHYQELRALRGVSLEVSEADLVALVGSNGAGKTTLLNTISGLLPAVKGHVSWRGNSILGLSADAICQAGIIQVPEGRKLFARMTVAENLEMGAYLPAARAHIAKNLQMVFEIFPRLAERRKQVASSLSGGEQQMVAVARAIMATPQLLMLDEPSLGLSPILVKEIFKLIQQINAQEGVSILLVEQNARLALRLANYGYVMENGRIVLDGLAEKLEENEDIKEFYLGLSQKGKRKSYREVKHYKRRKRWLS